MKEVSGDLLLFLDSDDLLTPRAIERLHQCLVDSEVDVAYGDALLVREGGVKERKVQRPPSSSHVISMLNAAPLTSSALIKKEAINGVRWRESLKRAHEFAFYLDLSLNGATFSYVEYDVLKDRDNAKERITDGGGSSSTVVGIGKVLADTEKKFRKMGVSENKAYDHSLIYIANLLCRQGKLELSKELFDRANRVRVWKRLFRDWNHHIFLTLSAGPKWSSKIYSILRVAKPK
jgi:glycosyltransferase involved in cell wall biosynthesis